MIATKPRIQITATENIPGTVLVVTCPDGHPFIVRENSTTGQTFAGCSHYPDCTATAVLVVIPDEQQPLL